MWYALKGGAPIWLEGLAHMTRSDSSVVIADRLLLSTDATEGVMIAPGLLRVLQQAVALRLVLAALAVVLYTVALVAGQAPGIVPIWSPWAFLVEAAIFLAFVLWDRPRRSLGNGFLPIALAWFLVAPVIEQALLLRALTPDSLDRLGPGGLPGIGFEALFLVIPVILATWQYGRRGLLAALGVLAVGQIVLAPVVGADLTNLAFYVLGSAGRLAMIALVGYVVLQLVNGLRSEHEGLVAANRQLAQRAATVEQLAESRERNRLARELHDTLAHSLTGLSVQLKALETLLVHDPAAAGAQLKEAQATVRSGIQEMRRAIQALRATPLEDLGLAEALRQLCDRLAERTGLQMHPAIAEIGALDPLTEQAIYRVAETALANVEQHAGASKAWVTLVLTPESRMRLEVRDDGMGFDPENVAGDRYGLAGMAERAQLIGAALRVESQPGQGARVIMEAST
jgi:signal transduction histidine kinase